MNLKNLLGTMVALVAVAHAQNAKEPGGMPAPGNSPAQDVRMKPAARISMEPGTVVNPASVVEAKWIKGEPMKSFEPGKVYLFECWATWCGPCIAAIPHMNDLHRKYHGKGLEIYGANVFEDDFSKVEAFVKNKNLMEYPVFFSGKASGFANDWLKPMGVAAIPTVIVVKDGKFWMTAHPENLTDSVIEMMLTQEDGILKARTQIEAKAKQMEETLPHLRKFMGHASRGEIAEMEAELAEVRKIDAHSKSLPTMELEMTMAKGSFQQATDSIAQYKDADTRQRLVSVLVNKALDDANIAKVDKGTWKAMFEVYQKENCREEKPSSPTPFVFLSMLSHQLGNSADELKYAKQAVELAKSADRKGKPLGGYETYLKEVEAGKHPTRNEFYSWVSVRATPMKPGK